MVITAPFVVFKERMMDKKEARRRQLAKIDAAVRTGQQDCDEKDILTHLYQSPEWQVAQTVGVTISSGMELATRPIIEHAVAAGKRVAVPRCLPHRQMAFWDCQQPGITWQQSPFGGIWEPHTSQPALAKAAIDLIVVPGLAFSPQHDRLGFGGGYYDRYLRDYPGTTVALMDTARQVGVAEWPVEPTDVRIKLLIGVNGIDRNVAE